MSDLQKKSIVVYNDKGISDQCLKALLKTLHAILDPQKYSIQSENAKFFKEQDLSRIECIIFGGGFDLGFIEALGKPAILKIRSYVEKGGKYLGICAGSYFACNYVIFDKGGPYEVLGERYLKFFPGDCIGPEIPGYVPSSERGSIAVTISTTHSDSDMIFKCYYNGGGQFANVMGTTTQVTSTYVNSGHASSVLCKVNQGKAFLSAIHFEFDFNTPGVLPEIQKQLKESDFKRKLFLKESLILLGINVK